LEGGRVYFWTLISNHDKLDMRGHMPWFFIVRLMERRRRAIRGSLAGTSFVSHTGTPAFTNNRKQHKGPSTLNNIVNANRQTCCTG
jgi:hypothetical protein